MTLTLAERRALLRDAVAGSAVDDVAGLATAIAGASEEDRAALAKTLPPTRLFRAEGPTPRACFAVAALGKPALAVETLVPSDLQLKSEYGPHHPTMVPAVFQAASERSPEWLVAFVDALAAQAWWGIRFAWPVCFGLVRACTLSPDSATYLGLVLNWLVENNNSGGTHEENGRAIADRLRADPYLIEREFWALFRVEGMGSHNHLTEWRANEWDTAVGILCDTEPGFRERILDESLGALLRDFPAKTITWYLRIHRLVSEGAEDITARQARYFAVLGTGPSTAVGLAQDMLKRVVSSPAFDIDGVIDASGAVLARTEKKLVKAQLALLAALDADEAQRQAISDLVTGMLDALAPDLRAVASRLVIADATSRVVPTTGDPVSVPEPRRTPILNTTQDAAPITDSAELRDHLAAQIEATGDGANLPRVLAALRSLGSRHIDSALIDRASEVFETEWDDNDASPRRQLADVLLDAAGRRVRQIHFNGFRRYVTLRKDESAPSDVAVEEHTMTSHSIGRDGIETIETSTFRSGYRRIPTHAPTALLAEQFDGQPTATPLPHAPRRWERVVREPGEGMYGLDSVLGGAAPKPFWLAVSESPASAHDAFSARALDVSFVAAEFTFRAHEAREQSGYEQIAQWTAWLLRENPDTLAAHAHPMLLTATLVANVRGTAPLFAALGAARHVPAEPTYSALALGLSAKMSEHRAQTAEAVAAIADSGLLDPPRFADEIAAHLTDGFAMAGRVAQGLSDAASISAISGYRVLQTLESLLPSLDGANQAGKLVELAARLADDYGTPVAVPPTLNARRKGSSALAVAVRALETTTPRPTDLAQDAAAQASAALAVENEEQ